MDVLTGLSAVSETLKITKELRNIDDKIAVADLKLKLSEVVDGLLEAKEALQDAKQRERDLEAKIEDLQNRLRLKSRLQDDEGCLYELDENGKRIGKPYCNHCFVKEEKLYRLVSLRSGNGGGFSCSNCDFLTRNN